MTLPPRPYIDHSPAPLTPAQVIGGFFAAWFFLTFLGLTYICTR